MSSLRLGLSAILPPQRQSGYLWAVIVLEAQKGDGSLARCLAAALVPEGAKNTAAAYFMEHGLLMRRWRPHASSDEWGDVVQLVVPTRYRQSVLSLAHDHHWSGHLGVTKTYDRVLRHFFWSGLKQDVSRFCRTCHVCQITGKPN